MNKSSIEMQLKMLMKQPEFNKTTKNNSVYANTIKKLIVIITNCFKFVIHSDYSISEEFTSHYCQKKYTL